MNAWLEESTYSAQGVQEEYSKCFEKERETPGKAERMGRERENQGEEGECP